MATTPSLYVSLGRGQEGRGELPVVQQIRRISSSQTLYYASHGLRHPGAIFNAAASQFADRLKRVLAPLGEWTAGVQDPTETWTRELLERQDAFLDASMEYLTDLDNVLLTFFPDIQSRNASSADRKYRAATGAYRAKIGALDNHIKHQQGRLRLVIASADGEWILGYFVEGASGELVGPDPRIHPSGRTAFSFARDLRFHLAMAVFASDALSTALTSLGVPIGSLQDPNVGWGQFGHVAASVSSLPKRVFPDEARMPWPQVTISSDGAAGGVRASFAYPGSSESPVGPSRGFELRAMTSGDGFTRSFRLPYFGQPPFGGW